MLFNSIKFILFFPIVTLVYYLVPKKYTWIWLLVSSYYFYMSWNPTYALLIITSTVITYLSGILIHKANKLNDQQRKLSLKRLYVALSFIINLSILIFFKYYNFVVGNIMMILYDLNILIEIPLSNMLLPVGISFYTFQALSYTMDVYRGDIKSENHLGHYALFVSFYPQLVAGPIERSKNLLPQIKLGRPFKYDNLKNGLIMMGWGLVKKVVIADRLAIVVNTVYNNPNEFSGIYLVVATVFFAFQIYCDFSAYSDIAIGCAETMGYKLMVNFRQPYFSKSIKEFWQRWHISLGTWFKEYLYIPLGGNRVPRFRAYLNILIIFLVSGFWHGANWTFIIWGGLHGMFQIIGQITYKPRKQLYKFLCIKDNTFGRNLIASLFTFVLVSFAWVFFRANSLPDALYIVKNLSLDGLSAFTAGGYLELGLDKQDFILGIVSIFILLLTDKRLVTNSLYRIIEKENLPFRWLIYLVIIFGIILLGFYGGYDASTFIYFQF